MSHQGFWRDRPGLHPEAVVFSLVGEATLRAQFPQLRKGLIVQTLHTGLWWASCECQGRAGSKWGCGLRGHLLPSPGLAESGSLGSVWLEVGSLEGTGLCRARAWVPGEGCTFSPPGASCGHHSQLWSAWLWDHRCLQCAAQTPPVPPIPASPSWVRGRAGQGRGWPILGPGPSPGE